MSSFISKEQRGQEQQSSLGERELALERRIETLDAVLFDYVSERSAELRKDPTIDQKRIEDIVAIEMEALRREREQLRNRLHGLCGELGLQQEMGMKR